MSAFSLNKSISSSLYRGTGVNEIYHKRVNHCWPEKCGRRTSDNLMLTIRFCWDIKRWFNCQSNLAISNTTDHNTDNNNIPTITSSSSSSSSSSSTSTSTSISNSSSSTSVSTAIALRQILPVLRLSSLDNLQILFQNDPHMHLPRLSSLDNLQILFQNDPHMHLPFLKNTDSFKCVDNRSLLIVTREQRWSLLDIQKPSHHSSDNKLQRK